MQQPVFINGFQKGTQENANIGFGTFVGIETYTKKGTARLTRDTTKKSSTTVTDLIKYFAQQDQATIWAQGDTGIVYLSTDTGETWSVVAGNTTGDNGRGLIYYNNYVFAFTNTHIEYYHTVSVSGWTTLWQPNGVSPALITGVEHFPFIYPGDNNIYFGNGNTVGKIGFGTATTFNPSGTGGTDYYYSAKQLTLPSFYTVNCISFLPQTWLCLGLGSSQNSQVADIIQWDPTLSTYQPPLRLYSPAAASENGVKQLINRNNVLYAVTGGNQCIFETNGTQFRLISDTSLRTRWNGATGQTSYPVFLDPQVSAICLLGNKLLTGTSTATITGQIPSSGSLFPMGVWTVAFTEEGEIIQCEFTISTNTIAPAAATYYIGALCPVTQNQALIGWRDGSTYGIDKIDYGNYQNDVSAVVLESPMFEIGTPLEPATVSMFEIFLTRQLLSGQQIQVAFRTGFDQNYAQINSDYIITGDDSTGQNYYFFSSNNIGQTRYVQFQIQMATGSPNVTSNIELRNIKIS